MKFDDAIPIYLQIKEEIEHSILTGALQEDQAIPSIRVMAQQYRLNPQTISNAIGELTKEDLLYKRRGVGMFVSPGAPRRLLAKKRKEYLTKDLRSTLKRGKSFQIEKQEIITVLNEIYDQGEVL
ncbi:MAG: GntR family transcriptional regulator [Candidatus Cloacimonetes bacterium]|nr:GntR family transcriptional regulator [Candidatus Cloacimonadota bacterium]